MGRDRGASRPARPRCAPPDPCAARDLLYPRGYRGAHRQFPAHRDLEGRTRPAEPRPAPPQLPHAASRRSRSMPAAKNPRANCWRFLERYPGRVLFAAESPGRREMLFDLLRKRRVEVQGVESWPEFLQGARRRCRTISPISIGLMLDAPALSLVAEEQLFGERARQEAKAAPYRARPGQDRPRSHRPAPGLARGARGIRRRSLSRPQDHGRRRHAGRVPGA